MPRLLVILTIFLLVSCGTFIPVYINNTIPGTQIKLSRYSDSCCGCQANVIDVKTSDSSEVKYWLHCNCDMALITKEELKIKAKKVESITKYQSLTEANGSESKIELNKLDSLILFQLSESMILDYGRNCDSTTYRLNSLTGFKLISESSNPRKVESNFIKKVKL